MVKEKSFIEFNMKDWKNFGIYITLLGLIIGFVGKELRIGVGFTLVGLCFICIFYGPKEIKIFKRKNW
jgi:hypothetical protein